MARRLDPRPRHQQIAAELRAEIMSGALKPGRQLPSTPHLVARFSAANATIQRALQSLKEEGVVRGHAGKGVFVRDRQPFVVEAAAYNAPAPRGYSYELLQVGEVEPPTDVAAALTIPHSDPVIMRHRLLLHDGAPVELSWSYYPPHIASGSPLAGRGKIRGGAPQALADLGFPERHFEDRISVRQPTTKEVERLDLPTDVPVFRQFRVIYSDLRRPVEVSILIKGGHLYELSYQQVVD
ncbi:GntR family transcriptional regulator [Streptosporangium sp. NBC_01810]|uniref:GntR family transcriptional regulator n=1 Tax=Streptosporangium sp. NBC_01810 TaxID=2975951 RepID=UPI002DDB0D6E|nr:GntR family transcriptional regulator [Streptosporangium sp. NBC_01810]WSA24918.1 GntR family transcriptional regulator [Streptosporangium sp. NBC_01810]